MKYAEITNKYFSLFLVSRLPEGLKGGFICLVLGEVNYDELLEVIDNAIANGGQVNTESIMFADVEGDSEEELIEHLKRHEKHVMGLVEKHYNVKMTRTPMQVIRKPKKYELNKL